MRSPLKILLVCLVALFPALPAISAGTFVQFRTTLGTIDVELYDEEKPGTTDNFKQLIKAGAYQNTFIHRLVPGFVAQGGSYKVLNKGSTNLFAPQWSELRFAPHFGTISNEFSTGPLLSNTNGTIAMAKVAGNPDSATSGWFFNLGNNSTNLDHQNGGFTVFGRVIRDESNVIGKLNDRSENNGIIDLGDIYPGDPTATNAFRELPVWYTGLFLPRYNDLIFVDITLLDVAINYTNGYPQISWTSVAGKTNTVEYTASMPPQWQPLFSVVPFGQRINLNDFPGPQRRFYRVRVDY